MEPQVDKTVELLNPASHHNRDRTKRTTEVKQLSCILDILEHGQKHAIARAVKLPWIYADGSDLVNINFLVRTLFSRISFSTRLKIFNNLGTHLKNTQTADQIFSAIESRYGFPSASMMLQACSEKVIFNSLLGNRSYQLSPSQLLTLVKTSPLTGLKYLKTLYTTLKNVKNDLSSSIKYLLDRYADLTLGILLKYPDKWDFSLGRRRSKKLLRLHREKVVEIALNKPDFLEHSQLRRFLSAQEYEQLFLKSAADLKELLKGYWKSEDLWKWLNHLPKARQQALLRNSFRVAFNKKITECPQHVTPDMLVILSDRERAKIVSWKVENPSGGYIFNLLVNHLPWIYENHKLFWKAMKPTNQSIPELTKVLDSEEDATQRSNILSCMIVSCIFNKDIEELTTVLRFLIKKYRSDHSEERRTLVHLISEALHHFEFEERLWACFQELLQLLQLHKETRNRALVEVLRKYAAYLQKCGKPFDTELELVIEMILDDYFECDTLFIERPDHEREMIEGHIRALSTVASKTGAPCIPNDAIVRLVQAISYWNQHHKKKFGLIDVSKYPWLERKCWEIMVSESDYDRNLVFQLLKYSNFELCALDEVLNKGICASLFDYCFKRKPEKIIDHAESIMPNILKESEYEYFQPYFVIFKKLRTKCGWPVIDKIKAECKKVLDHDDPTSVITEACNAFRLLAVVLDTSEFLNFASKYYSAEAKLDSSVSMDVLDRSIKETIFKSLKYLRDSKLALDVICNFLMGDDFKLALSSFYSICLAIPEKEALVYLQSQLKNRPPNVQKHMIHLLFLVSPLHQKSNVLKEMWPRVKDPSIRCKILAEIYTLFKSIPDKEMWELLKLSIGSLTKEDIPSVKYIKRAASIDESLGKFTPEFFEMVLETFKHLGVYDEYKDVVILRIADSITNLDDDFLDIFVLKEFGKSPIFTDTVHGKFAINYVMDETLSSEFRAHRLKLLQSILQDMVDYHWNVTKVNADDPDSPIFPSRRFLRYICYGISSFLLEHRTEISESKKEMLRELIAQFQDRISFPKAFKNVIYMQLTLIALESTESDEFDWLQSFGKRVAPFLSLCVKKCGGEVTSVVSEVLKEVSKKMMKTDNENILRIIDGLLSDKNEKCHLLVAIDLLPQGDQNSTELSTIHKRIINILKHSSNVTVQIHFNLWQNNNDSVDEYHAPFPFRC